MFTYSKQFFDAVLKGKRTTEKRLMIDITSARQFYRELEIKHVGQGKGMDSPTDGMCVIKCTGAFLRILKTGKNLTPFR